MLKLELPEVETYRRDLEREVVGRRIKSADALKLEAMPRIETKQGFEDPLVGAKVTGAERMGLTLVLKLDNDQAIVITLGEQGRMLKGTAKEAPGPDVVAVITFTQGGDVRIIDPDATTEVHVQPADAVAEVLPESADVGLDFQTSPISWVDFGRTIRLRPAPLKLLLTDPTVFVGIGDIYSNEILFDAGLRHDRPSEQLSTQEIRRLYRSVAGIIHDAIKYGGTSLPERPFVNLSGEQGEYAEYLAVWDKASELSPRSRVPIKKTSFKNQVVYFCSTQV